MVLLMQQNHVTGASGATCQDCSVTDPANGCSHSNYMDSQHACCQSDSALHLKGTIMGGYANKEDS
jgi:hypothetical protein